MIHFLRWLEGIMTVRLISADICGFLLQAQQLQLELMDVYNDSALTITFRIRRGDWKALKDLALRRGEKLEIAERKGLYWSIVHLRKRPVLVAGLLALLLFSAWLPGRVFFVQVDGNVQIPARQILECASRCGISFGASRRDVRSEKMKNALLEQMPELSWAGVNTYGCTAVITVRERNDPDITEDRNVVSSIVADRDGVIEQITVLRGNVLCKVGQAVREGQVLISGYTDCGLSIQATSAAGEVIAMTNRQLHAVLPTIFATRGEILTEERKYSLIIGNKRINFSNNSGISGSGCAKIYEEKYIVLPGGFQLPLAICTETWITYESQELTVTQSEEALSGFSREYLLAHMTAGMIMFADEAYTLADNVLLLKGNYACREMIGIIRIEENLLHYGEND